MKFFFVILVHGTAGSGTYGYYQIFEENLDEDEAYEKKGKYYAHGDMSKSYVGYFKTRREAEKAGRKACQSMDLR